MIETLMDETGSAAPAVDLPAPGHLPSLPRPAKSVLDTGLEPRLLTELVVKALEEVGKTPLPILSRTLRLSVSVLREILNRLIAEQQVEVAWCGDSDMDVHYALTGPGQRSAADYLARCRYVGPAPVPLSVYRNMVERQSLRQPGAARVSPAELAAALSDHALDPAAREVIGAALHAHRSLLLYGPPGSGKSTLARKLGLLLQGLVAVPYAVLVDRQIVQLHDPQVHLQPAGGRQQVERGSCDLRWTVCQRPLVHVGAGLTRAMLDLRYDAVNGVYRAPPHMQANNGLLIIDDVGGQQLPAAEMLSRWVGPLERGADRLSVQGSPTDSVPLDATVVFATSLAPDGVFGDAWLRRIRYKVALGPLSETAYRALLRQECRARQIDWDEAAADHLLAGLHRPAGRPLLMAYPYELLGRIEDFAGFAGTAPQLTVAALDQAWHSMFWGGNSVTAVAERGAALAGNQ